MRRISAVFLVFIGLPIGLPTGAAVAASPTAPVTAAAPPTAAGSFVPLPSVRILDTRTGLGAPKASIAAGATLTVTVAGRGGVPGTGVGAAWLTVTVNTPAASGQLIVFPAGSAAPTAPSVTFPTGRSASAATLARLGTGGAVTFRNTSGRSIAVTADVGGYTVAGAPTQNGGIGLVAPAVLSSTRIAGSGTVAVAAAGHAGIPSSGVAAVIVSLTAEWPTGSGTLSAYPAGDTRPDFSQLAYDPGRGATNLAVIRVNTTSGAFTLFNNALSAVPVRVVAVGWIRSGNPKAVGAFFKVAPATFLDTASGGIIPEAPIGSGVTVPVAALGRAHIPATHVSAVVLTLTASSTGSGHVTVFPTGSTTPPVVSAAYTPGRTTSDLVTVPVGADGRISFFNGGSGALTLRADVVGYIVGTAATPPAGGAWGTPHSIDANAGQGVAVSCTGPTFCMAFTNHDAIAYNGSAWGAPTVLATSDANNPAPDRDYSQDLKSLDCVSPTSCQGSFFYASADGVGNDAFAVGFNGSAWATQEIGTFNVGLPAPTSISCVSATSCSALYGDRSRDSFYRFNGSIWTRTGSAGTADGALTALSCLSASFCMAVGQAGQARVLSGTGFGPESVVDTAGLTGVSCASTTFCVAVDGAGKALRYNGSSWTTPSAVSPYALTSVSCASAGFCAAVDTAGNAVQFNGSTWSAPLTIDSVGLVAVSCPTAQFCVAMDSARRVVIGPQA